MRRFKGKMRVFGLDAFKTSLNGKIYWTANISDPPWNQGKIMCADLDGTNIETVVTGAGKPADIALDAIDGKVYWTDYAFDVVRRANLDGTDVEDLYVVGANLNPGGIALDRAEGRVYWGQDITSSPHTAKIMRMNLDGSNPEDVADGFGLVSDITLPATVPGDLDVDGDIALDDYESFADCLTGPGTAVIPGCEKADLEFDCDVDMADFAVFQLVF